MGMAAWGMLGLLAIAVFWAVGARNRLLRLRNQVVQAFGQLDVPLRQRRELVDRWVEAARADGFHDGLMREALLSACRHAQEAEGTAAASPMSAGALGALASAEQVLGSALARLLFLIEREPQLHADAGLQGWREELSQVAQRIGYAHQAYNDQVHHHNEAVLQFPTVVWARLLGFMPLDMLAPLHHEGRRSTVLASTSNTP